MASGNSELIEFGNIMSMVKGKKPIEQSSNKQDGFVPYINIRAFEKGEIEQYAHPEKCITCNENDLLIVCDGSRSGLVGRAKEGVVGSTLAKINATGLTIDYLYYFLQGKYEILNSRTKGTGTPHVDPEVLKSFRLVIPDFSVQKLIVERIEALFSELDKAVETLQTIKQQLEIYRQAVLNEAFAHIKNKKKIVEMSDLVTSGSRGWAKFYAGDGSLFIRIGNLTRTTIEINLDDVQYVALPEQAEGLRSRLRPNDVLVSITADLGSIGFVPEGIGEAYINQHIAMIRFKNPKQGKLMAWYLRSEHGQKDLLKNKRGGGKLGLGLDDIRNSRVPDVSDFESNKLVEKIEMQLSVCEKISETVTTSLEQADAIRKSILKQAFEGRLI